MTLAAANVVAPAPLIHRTKAYAKCTKARRVKGATPASVLAVCEHPRPWESQPRSTSSGDVLERLDGLGSPQDEWLTRADPPLLIRQHSTRAGAIRLRSDKPADQEEGAKLLRKAACSGFSSRSVDGEGGGHARAAPMRWVSHELQRYMAARAHANQTAPAGAPPLDYRVTIENDTAKVFYELDGKSIEAKPGKFRIVRQGQTTVISSFDSGWDFEGQWIETWTFHLLRTSEKSAFVNFVRTVNNPYLPVTFNWKTFSVVAEGTS